MPVNGILGLTSKFEWHNGTTFAEVEGLDRIDHNLGTRDSVDTTDFSATGGIRKFIPGLLDPGTVEIEGKFDPDNTVHTALWNDFRSLTNSSRQFRITLSDPVPKTITGTAILQSFAYNLAPNNVLRFTASFKITGDITIA